MISPTIDSQYSQNKTIKTINKKKKQKQKKKKQTLPQKRLSDVELVNIWCQINCVVSKKKNCWYCEFFILAAS